MWQHGLKALPKQTRKVKSTSSLMRIHCQELRSEKFKPLRISEFQGFRS
jgi:hypothetical protein